MSQGFEPTVGPDDQGYNTGFYLDHPDRPFQNTDVVSMLQSAVNNGGTLYDSGYYNLEISGIDPVTVQLLSNSQVSILDQTFPEIVAVPCQYLNGQVNPMYLLVNIGEGEVIGLSNRVEA